MSNIAVIGAGITGITTAYELTLRGHRVTVFDKNRYSAMETSFANGGQLSASNAEVWNSLGTVVKGISWMFRQDAPLLFNPKPSWHKYSWMAEFLGNIPQYRKNTVATTRMAIAARERMFEIAQNESIHFDLERRGILHIYKDRSGFNNARKANVLLFEGGLDRQMVTPEEIQTIEPTLDTSGLFAGYYTSSDSTGDIHKFTRGLAEACKRRGTSFLYETNVTKLVHTHWGFKVYRDNIVDIFDSVVVCAGVASRRFAAQLGDRINIYPVKGYSITVNLDKPAQSKAPWVSLLDESTKIVTSRLGKDRFRVAGTAEFNGYNRDIRWDRIQPLINWTQRYFPEVNTDQVVPWAGLRPMTPSMLPKVGEGSIPGVYYNTGHGHLGWTLSAATSSAIAATIGNAKG